MGSNPGRAVTANRCDSVFCENLLIQFGAQFFHKHKIHRQAVRMSPTLSGDYDLRLVLEK